MLVRSVYADGSLSLAHYISVFGDPRQAGLLGRSLGIALAASVFATLLGVIQAFLILRSNLSVRRFWRRIYLLPLCIPPMYMPLPGFIFAVRPGF
jgi:ABC-type Fe3+ transport system permease subunit